MSQFDVPPDKINSRMSLIFDAVAKALEPFRPIEITLYIIQERDELEVSIKNFPSLTKRVPIHRESFAFYPHAAYVEQANRVYDAYYNIPRAIAPPSNVTLGEN